MSTNTNQSGTSIAGGAGAPAAGGTAIAGGATPGAAKGGTAIAGGAPGVAKGGTAIAGGAHGAAKGGTAIAGGAPAGPGGTAVAGGAPAAGSPMAVIPDLPEYTIGQFRFKNLGAVGAASGEGRVFIVENGGNKFALKLYITGHTPDTSLLDAVKEAKGGFMIYLRDHGMWTDPNHPGQVHYYELMDYVPHGSLADVRIKTDAEFKAIATGMAFCIKQCHDRGFIHRDIKPENFLRTSATLSTNPRDRQFVLTDFGIGRMMGGKNTIVTDLGKTGRYASPEACYSSDNVTVEVGFPTDYYSMGLTLLAMCIGVNTFPMVCADKELDTYKRKGIVMEELGKMIKLSDYSKSLLEALLDSDPDKRAGFSDFQRWFGGETLVSSSAAKGPDAFRIVFNEDKNEIATNTAQLAALMLKDPDYAKGFLYRGTLVRALERVGRTKLSGDIDDIVQRIYPGADQQDVGVYAACLLLDQALTYTDRRGNKASSVKEIADLLWKQRVYYAVELKNKTSRLWAYLSMRGDATLKAFPAKYQPMVQRSGQHGIYAICKALDPSMPFTSIDGKTLTKPAEIAANLWANRDKYAGELGNPDHSLWTYLRSLGARAAKVADEYPELIRKSSVNNIYALCLQLDEETPYYGKDGDPCYDVQDIADEIWKNLGAYFKELASPEHMLWKYMLTWNDSTWSKIAREYPEKIARDADWVYELVYRMDATKPYPVLCIDREKNELKNYYDVKTFSEFIDTINKHGIKTDKLKYICEPMFITWLTLRPDPNEARRGALLEKLVKDCGANASKMPWYLLYSIAPELSLTLVRDPKQPGYVATPEQIGEYINYYINREKSDTVPSRWDIGRAMDVLAMTKTPSEFRNSRIAQFMKARKMDKYVDGIASILDVQANVNAHKSAPYDLALARYKVVSYLGANPVYLTAGGKNLRSLNDVKGLSSSDRDTETRRTLPQYSALYFYEQGTFSFDKVKQYYNFLESYLPEAYSMQSSRHERQQVVDTIRNRNKAWASLAKIRKMVMIFCLIPMIFTVGWMMYMSFTDGAMALKETFQSIGNVVAVILAIAGVICGFAGGIFGAIIGGLAGYWIPIWIFGWLSGIASWIVSGIVMAAAIFFISKLYQYSQDSHIKTASDYNRLYDQAMMYIVCTGLGTATRTFGSNSVNPSQAFANSARQANSQKSSAYKAAVGMIILAAATLGIGILLMDKVKTIETSPVEEAYYGTSTLDAIVGGYTGAVKDKDATMTLVDNSADKNFNVKGTIKVGTKTNDVLGTFDETAGTLELYVVRNGMAIKDNCYSGTIFDGSFTGSYTPYSGASRQVFTFNKN